MYSYALLGSGVSGNVGSDLVNRGGAARAILKTEVSLDGVHNRLRLDGIEAQITGKVRYGSHLQNEPLPRKRPC